MRNQPASAALPRVGRASVRRSSLPTHSRVASAGGKLKIVAYLHDQVAIKQVLAHLGLSPPEEPKHR